MAQYGKELSNLSYTNKDFNAIYSELLDLVSKISYKWDPTVSDESDPGVVLLKLAALMTDKLNYNIDKNILELFPLSVTQLDNARQIFDQCGYSMRYYRSADVEVSLTLLDEPDITDTGAEKMGLDIAKKDEPQNVRLYHIPKFTMVSDSENNYVYTIVEDAYLSSKGETHNVKALQGVATTYTVNGDPLVTPENIDYNRRLYFTELDVAENGIFIKNNLFDYSDWKVVDNLMIQPLNTPCYKFGVSPDGNSCYIEFPTDIDGLIGDGLEITYIRTSGVEGNIGKKFLSQFFGDVKANRYLASRSDVGVDGFEEISVNTDNIYITNVFATTSGQNPESIEEAYLNYERVKNTFDTLVSIRDYTNYIISSNMVSNGFVCDRTNDIQNTHNVLSIIADGTKTNTIVESKQKSVMGVTTDGTNTEVEVSVDVPSMSAFDLKIYGLTYTPHPETLSGYPTSFVPVELVVSDIDNTYVQSSDILKTNAFNDIRCIQHDFRTLDTNKIVMLKNKYPIVVKIVPQYKITNIQQADMISKVISALQGALNSQKIAFGDEISYDLIYDTIINSDPRIKAIMLDNIEYQTYAVYIEENEDTLSRIFKEIRIDDGSSPYEEVTVGAPKDSITYYTKDENGEFNEVSKENLPKEFSISKNKYYIQVASPELWLAFRSEIYAKSVVAGRTQMFKDNNQFSYSLNQSDFEVVDDIYSIDTNADIIVKVGTPTVISENENIVFTCPNLIREQQYSTYIKRFYKFNSDVSRNEDYQLSDGEWIAFFWKEDENTDTPYTYCKYSAGSIICPTFTIKKDSQINNESGNRVYVYDEAQQSALGAMLEDGQHTCEGLNITTHKDDDPSTQTVSLTDYIAGFSGSLYALTGSNQVETKIINKIHINNPKNGTRSVFWILNTVETNTITNSSYYQLFHDYNYDEELNLYTYTLKSGEYFMYANASKTSLSILGQGTKITTATPPSIQPGLGESWRCPVISYEDLMSYGIPYITENNYWYTLSENTDVYATEMQFYQLGPGTTLKVNLKDSTKEVDTVVISGDTVSFLNKEVVVDENISLSDFTISYLPEDANEDTVLPNKNSKELSWQSYSILNIDCGKNSIQYLKSTHSVSLFDKNREQIGEQLSGCCMVASDDIEVTGGINISTQKMNYNTGILTPVSFAKFQFEGVDDRVTHINVELSKTVTVLENGETTPIEFQLPVGEYIIKIINSGEFESLDAYVEVDENATKLNSIVGGESRLYNGEGSHCLYLNIEENVPHKLYFDVTSSKFPMSIQICSPYRYNLESSLMDDPDLYDRVMENLAILDNNLFDYTYQVSDEDLVVNPLDANEFVNPSHIYNKYTICMWDIQDTITITNKVK